MMGEWADHVRGTVASLRQKLREAEQRYKALAEEHAKEQQLHLYYKNHRYEYWDEGFEAACDWIANNPTPAGIPVDPPTNPYREDG